MQGLLSALIKAKLGHSIIDSVISVRAGLGDSGYLTLSDVPDSRDFKIEIGGKTQPITMNTMFITCVQLGLKVTDITLIDSPDEHSGTAKAITYRISPA